MSPIVASAEPENTPIIITGPDGLVGILGRNGETITWYQNGQLARVRGGNFQIRQDVNGALEAISARPLRLFAGPFGYTGRLAEDGETILWFTSDGQKVSDEEIQELALFTSRELWDQSAVISERADKTPQLPFPEVCEQELEPEHAGRR